MSKQSQASMESVKDQRTQLSAAVQQAEQAPSVLSSVLARPVRGPVVGMVSALSTRKLVLPSAPVNLDLWERDAISLVLATSTMKFVERRVSVR